MRINNIIDDSELEFYSDRDEPLIETCDIYSTHGNPNGDEHYACLDQLFDGEGFSVKNKNSYKINVDEILNMALEAVSFESLNFNQYGKLVKFISNNDNIQINTFYSMIAKHPESFVYLVEDYINTDSI